MSFIPSTLRRTGFDLPPNVRPIRNVDPLVHQFNASRAETLRAWQRMLTAGAAPEDLQEEIAGTSNAMAHLMALSHG